MLITVFTPTYNRAYRLQALYESLCRQTFHDFEWLIVDDGSTDDTESIVAAWIAENRITIRYYKQPNGGKHRAINRGVNMAEGLLFFIVDSDDILPDDSLKLISEHYDLIKDRPQFGGLCGLKAYYSGETVGQTADFGILECTNFDIDYKYKLKGDMSEVFYTSVLKEFPFPEIEGEKFCPEILVWNRISTKYIIHYFSKITYLCEYLPDGLTSRIARLRMNSPIASCMTYHDIIAGPTPLWAKFRAAINFWRFAKYADQRKRPQIHFFWLIAKPAGMLFSMLDAKRQK